MIVSASYKTDIPAFYADWFRRRLAAGRARMINPYGGQVYTVELSAPACDGFVFWTRNPEPFMAALADVRTRGLPFVVQVTVTTYPRPLETSVVPAERAVAAMRAVAERFGRETVVWRYDPVLLTSLTPPDWHRRAVACLADSLRGVTDEVAFSFATIYRKTRRNTDAAAQRHGFAWWDPPAEEKTELLRELAEIAAARGMAPRLCAQPELLPDPAESPLRPAACIDAARLSRVAGREIAAPVRNTRPGCHCAQARDIGDYDSCPHGCVYCYAVRRPDLAKRRYRAHDPDSEFLIAPARPGGNEGR